LQDLWHGIHTIQRRGLSAASQVPRDERWRSGFYQGNYRTITKEPGLEWRRRELCCRDALALRNRTSDVLKVVNTDLGAVPISDEDLWSQTHLLDADTIQAPDSKPTEDSQDQSRPTPVDRFKTYLYIQGQKCIGACLAERIWKAYTVLPQDGASAQTRELPSQIKSSSISISATTTPALLGVSRIWTSNQHRKQGIATRLLDCARSDFFFGLSVEKAKVAFSQPTESGGNLARRWFGCEDGWCVYID
jgi:N-acetyltransferase